MSSVLESAGKSAEPASNHHTVGIIAADSWLLSHDTPNASLREELKTNFDDDRANFLVGPNHLEDISFASLPELPIEQQDEPHPVFGFLESLPGEANNGFSNTGIINDENIKNSSFMSIGSVSGLLMKSCASLNLSLQDLSILEPSSTSERAERDELVMSPFSVASSSSLVARKTFENTSTQDLRSLFDSCGLVEEKEESFLTKSHPAMNLNDSHEELPAFAAAIRELDLPRFVSPAAPPEEPSGPLVDTILPKKPIRKTPKQPAAKKGVTTRSSKTAVVARKKKRKGKYSSKGRIYVQPTENDVKCGRGGACNSWPGNHKYLADKNDKFKTSYKNATTPMLKTAIVTELVACVRKRQGRFLRREEGTDLWYEIPYKEARKKACQALREKYDTPGKRAIRRSLYPHASKPVKKKKSTRGRAKKPSAATNP